MRRLAELLLYVLLTLGPVAGGIAAIDFLVGATATGRTIGTAGIALTALGIIGWAIVRPPRQGLARLVAVFAGMWSIAAFVIFIGWRIGTAAESAAACGDGDAEACYAIGVRKERRARFDQAANYLAPGCELGHARACFELGGLIASGRVPGPGTAADRFVAGCAGGVAPSCERAGIVLRESDPVRSREVLEAGCRLGSASACSALPSAR